MQQNNAISIGEIDSLARLQYLKVKSHFDKLGVPYYDFETKRSVNSTPVLDISGILNSYTGGNGQVRFYLKEEYKNPLTKSVKGRAVAAMVLDAIRSRSLFTTSGAKKKWIEPTSGNTGKGLAEIADLLDVDFTAIFSRLDVSRDIKASIKSFGGKMIAIGCEYSVDDLEALAQRHQRQVVYYWATPNHMSEQSLRIFRDKISSLRKSSKGGKEDYSLVKEIDPTYLVESILPAAAEALRTPLIARIERGEFDQLRESIVKQIPELKNPSFIVGFLCPLGNTSMAFNTLFSQLGFDNVCNVMGGVESLLGKGEVLSAEYCPLPGSAIYASSIDFVKKLVQENQDEYFTFMQYDNIENVNAHRLTTGPELLRQVRDLSAVMCTFGTGGTATGLAEFFKDKGVSVCVAFPKRPVEGIRTLRGAEGLAFYKPDSYGGIIEVDNSKGQDILKSFVNNGVMIGPSTAIALGAALDLRIPNGKSCAIIAADDIGNYRTEYSSLLQN